VCHSYCFGLIYLLYFKAKLLDNIIAWDILSIESFVFLFGAFMFLFHIPERWLADITFLLLLQSFLLRSPGTFDYWGQSHTIFHVTTVVGAVFHHMSIIKTMSWWHLNNPTCDLSLDDMLL
jgi:predicted membrane channel-forming protein YqfA (hemolysin III family)